MRERFWNWFGSVAGLQVIALVALCLLVAGAFALGMIVAQAQQPLPPPPLQAQPNVPPDADLPVRGTFGAIDRIEGNTIRLRDPRSGRVWTVRAGDQTVIENGPRRPIPFQALRPGQRVFVIGSPGANNFDATFIGVVLGEKQFYLTPARLPHCEDCFH